MIIKTKNPVGDNIRNLSSVKNLDGNEYKIKEGMML